MKKKIIFFAYNLDIGGIERAVLNFIKNIDNKKYDITLFLEKYEGIYKEEVPSYVHIINYNICENKNRLIRKIVNGFKILYYSIKYHNNFYFSASFASSLKSSTILAKRFSKNNALWFHGKYWFNNNDAEKYLKYVSADKYKKIVFVAEDIKKDYLHVRNNTNQKLYVLNNMINADEMIEKANESINVKKDKITLLNVGRHEENQKKLTMLLNSCAKAIKSGYDFNLWLVGDGDDHGMYIDLVKKLKIEDHVKFFGKKDNVFPYYKLCDAVVLSSAFEGNPVVYLEAKVMNKPVISTDVSDAKKELDGFGIVTSSLESSFYNGLIEFLKEGYKIKNKFNATEYNKDKLEKLYKIIED